MLLRLLLSIVLPGCFGFFIAFLLNLYVDAAYFYNTHYLLIFYAALFLTMNSVYWLNAKSKAFTELLLAGLVIKFLATLIVIVVYSVINNAKLFQFSMHLLLYYILFTVFEIRYLQQLIKTNQTNK